MIRALLLALLLTTSKAHAVELSLGVFLPSAAFVTNAERSAWSDTLAKELNLRAQGAFTVRAQVFARKEDIKAFEGRLDLLVVDPLYGLESGLELVAHVPGVPLGLYGLETRTVGSLERQAVGYAVIGQGELALYSNTVLGGELEAATFFGSMKPYKDVGSALTAVKSREVAAAFAPRGHPASNQLVLLAEGGVYPRAVVGVARPRAALVPTLKRVFGGLPAQALGTFASGTSADLERIRARLGSPRVLNAPALLTAPPVRLHAPPVRLEGRGKIPAIDTRGLPLATPTLPEAP
jgi:hypothetical protein